MSSERTTPHRRRRLGPPEVEAAVHRAFRAPRARPRSRRFIEAWRGTLRLLRPLGRLSLGNHVEVHCDGDVVFERLWGAIREARARVSMNTYILEPDRVGLRTLDELRGAAERGVDVRLVYDAFGSSRLTGEHVRPLREAGARVVAFNPIAKWPWGAARLIRNHRKILVVDGERAFCGGMNVSEDYAGRAHGNGRFRDTHLELGGPAASDLEGLCEELARGPRPRGEARLIDGRADRALVQILESNVPRHRRAIQRALRWTLGRSQLRCYLTSPYFVPPARLIRQLIRAARRGVDVRVLTAGVSDVPIVHLASQHLYGRLLRQGVRIYEMYERVLHAKTAAIDGVYASVGSFNLDHWSYRRNLEVTVGVLDRPTTKALEDQFERDLAGSREVRFEAWASRTLPQRALHWLAYQLMRL